MSLCRPMVSTSFWVKPTQADRSSHPPSFLRLNCPHPSFRSIGIKVKPTQADRSSHPPSFLTLNRPPPSFRSIGNKDAYYGTLLREYHNIPFAKGCCTEIGTETVTFRLTNRDRTPGELSTFKILGPGMIILKNYLSLKDQVDIVKLCDKMTFGLRGYYMYKSDVDCRRQMCFGRNWAPETRYKNRYMSNGLEPLPIPDELISLAEAAIQDAQIHLDQLPSMRPDTCLANFYQSEGRLGLHQDDDESPDSLERGLPVVSISIGDMAEFVYGHTRDKKELKSVMLKSGDVLIFGGKSRLIYHGVTQIYLYTSPEPLIEESGLRPGRLSLTLRQF